MYHLDIDSIRTELPAVSRVAYFNAGAEGPQPLRAIQAQAEMASHIALEGPSTPECRRRAVEIASGARRRVAKLLGCDSTEVALGHSTSHGIGIVASGLDWEPGDEVVFDELEHCSGIAPWLHYAVRYGIKPVCVRSSHGTVDAESIAAAFTGKTRLVCISHVTYSTGAVLPVKAICEAARQRGILTLIDGAQSTGRLPIDVKDVGCDAYAAPGHKWLLGPAGTGALYVSPNAMGRLSPSVVAWASLQSDNVSSLNYALHTDARRFELASLNAPMFAAFNASVDFLESIGWDAIRERSSALVSRLIEGIEAVQGASVLTPKDPASRAGLVTFSLPIADLQSVVDRLYEEDAILVRVIAHPQGIRAAVHVYNTEEEIDRLIDAVRRALAS